MVRVYASQLEGLGYEPWLSHTKDFKNGTNWLLALRSIYEYGVGKLNTCSTKWTSPLPTIAFIAFADMWPGAN